MLYSDYLNLFQTYVVGVFPFVLFVNAPHGKLAQPTLWFSKGYVPGRLGWILMELVAPVTFLYALQQRNHSLAPGFVGDLSLHDLDPFRKVLAFMFLIHYANRAIVSPLIFAPHVSPMHWTVFVSAILFNFLNGMSIGLYLLQATVQHHPISLPWFIVGGCLWFFGWIGNIYHDNILYDLRRRPLSKAQQTNSSSSTILPSHSNEEEVVSSFQSHYKIPYGGLFTYVSCPNYFCEWIEWFGCYLAAGMQAEPIWWFFLAEILLMLPRAYRIHSWYRSHFSRYPEDRLAVIPFLF
ncbi:steroid reductase [Schizosaccharomyces osmophilus]|uniref:Steroid reductase n=1 Tax=Schizosaccharomyces osmophilus TaxID=2545709 RepID=A0AAF0AUR9_9SCHI|nr:steroid reductase [Schizosaccharomyces osmophilus]WBW71897.1 steroid reductase [Schizosaccharomyces osmophilus]